MSAQSEGWRGTSTLDGRTTCRRLPIPTTTTNDVLTATSWAVINTFYICTGCTTSYSSFSLIHTYHRFLVAYVRTRAVDQSQSILALLAPFSILTALELDIQSELKRKPSTYKPIFPSIIKILRKKIGLLEEPFNANFWPFVCVDPEIAGCSATVCNTKQCIISWYVLQKCWDYSVERYGAQDLTIYDAFIRDTLTLLHLILRC